MEETTFDVELTESPAGIKFGHGYRNGTLIASKVNPNRIAYSLGVRDKDLILEINGEPIKDSKIALEKFRSLSRGENFPIILKINRIRLVELDDVLPTRFGAKDKALIDQILNEGKYSFSSVEKTHNNIYDRMNNLLLENNSTTTPQHETPFLPKTFQQENNISSQNDNEVFEPSLAQNLDAQVLFNGIWFPAKVSQLNEEFYHTTIVYSELAQQHDVIGLSPTLPAHRVHINYLQKVQTGLEDYVSKETFDVSMDNISTFGNVVADVSVSFASNVSSFWSNTASTYFQSTNKSNIKNNDGNHSESTTNLSSSSNAKFSVNVVNAPPIDNEKIKNVTKTTTMPQFSADEFVSYETVYSNGNSGKKNFNSSKKLYHNSDNNAGFKPYPTTPNKKKKLQSNKPNPIADPNKSPKKSILRTPIDEPAFKPFSEISEGGSFYEREFGGVHGHPAGHPEFGDL